MKLPAGKLGRVNWADHVRSSEEYQGSVSDYCRFHGLSIHSLGYHKRKLRSKQGGFAELKVVGQSTYPQLPDPTWLAQFIHSFLDQQ